jgi:membrane-associated phospholipid phosphatase
VVEQVFKAIFRRERPLWTVRQTQWVIPGEHLSFPSGHTLRAFFWCFLMADSALVARWLAYAGIGPPTVWQLLPWAVMVSLSRVAKVPPPPHPPSCDQD